ncbi:MAG: GNAT family N-acetyltransferase [Chloroflexota bacterium]
MASELRAIYLTGDRVYLRAHVEEDKNCAMAWHPGPFPINSARAEEVLKEWHKEFWPRTRRFAVCSVETDEVVGGVSVSFWERNADIDMHTAPWLENGNEVKGDVLKIVIPWLSEEWDRVAVTAVMPADHADTIEAAESLGMEHTATFREFYARPGGARADQLIYQKLNPRGEFPDA